MSPQAEEALKFVEAQTLTLDELIWLQGEIGKLRTKEYLAVFGGVAKIRYSGLPGR